jgi:hypothetical protein
LHAQICFRRSRVDFQTHRARGSELDALIDPRIQESKNLKTPAIAPGFFVLE